MQEPKDLTGLLVYLLLRTVKGFNVTFLLSEVVIKVHGYFTFSRSTFDHLNF